MLKPSFEVICVEESMARSKSGIISGIIYFRINDCSFPDTNWYDSVVVIMDWWLNELRGLLVGEAQVAQLRFMEGAFRMDVRPAEGAWRIVCVDGSGSDVGAAVEVAPRSTACDILDVADRVVQWCDRRNWSHGDIEALSSSAQRFRNCFLENW